MKTIKKIAAILFITLFLILLFGSVNAQCDAIINGGDITMWQYLKTTVTSGAGVVLVIYIGILLFWLFGKSINCLTKN